MTEILGLVAFVGLVGLLLSRIKRGQNAAAAVRQQVLNSKRLQEVRSFTSLPG